MGSQGPELSRQVHCSQLRPTDWDPTGPRGHCMSDPCRAAGHLGAAAHPPALHDPAGPRPAPAPAGAPGEGAGGPQRLGLGHRAGRQERPDRQREGAVMKSLACSGYCGDVSCIPGVTSCICSHAPAFLVVQCSGAH